MTKDTHLRTGTPRPLREERLPGPNLNAALKGSLPAAVLGDTDVPRGHTNYASLKERSRPIVFGK